MTRSEYETVKGLLALTKKMFGYLEDATKALEGAKIVPKDLEFDEFTFVQKTKAIIEAHESKNVLRQKRNRDDE